MQDNFHTCLKEVLRHEGGFVWYPQDPGGATMRGVTLATFRDYKGRDVTPGELKNISDEDVETIYRDLYWDKCHCDDLPYGVDYAVFDAAVNSGWPQAVRWLQGSVNAHKDGIVGQLTLRAVRNLPANQVIDSLCAARLTFLQSLTVYRVFGKGWDRRVSETLGTAKAMAANAYGRES